MLHSILITSSNLIVTLRSKQQRAHYEDSLKESEARGRAILEGAIEAIVTIDQQGLIEDVNPAPWFSTPVGAARRNCAC
jgi:two-component system sensor kinase FixL